MARHVVSNTFPRCERCRHPHRWCICAAHKEVISPVSIDILMHSKESAKPTSTGHLIHRVVRDSRLHIFGGIDKKVLDRSSILIPDKELWVLHPRGDPMPSSFVKEQVQVLLLDGTWKQSIGMMQSVEGWGGRRICLPMQGVSRFKLRNQQAEGHFSTVEALLFLLEAIGATEAEQSLRLQFELHVYAGLKLRGNKALADTFLSNSTVLNQIPEVIEELLRPRSNPYC